MNLVNRIDIRLIQILKTFSNEELKSFQKFLGSPYADSRRHIDLLLKELKKFHPDYDPSELKKEKLFRRLFPGEKFLDKKITNLIFDLTKAAESFIKHNMLEEEDFDSRLFLARAYYKKKLYRNCIRVCRIAVEKLGHDPLSEDHFQYVRDFNDLLSRSCKQFEDYYKVFEFDEKSYEAAAIKFLMEYTQLSGDLIWISRWQSKYNSGKMILESIRDSFDIDKFFKKIIASNEINMTLINLYYYYTKILQDPDNEDYYHILKKKFFTLIDDIEGISKRNISSLLREYCIRKIYSGRKIFKKELYELTKREFENNIYNLNDKEYAILPLVNVFFSSAFDVKDYSTPEKFIREYAHTILPEFRDDFLAYLNARLYFEMKDYKKSFEHAGKVKNLSKDFRPQFKILLLKLCYELNYYEQAFSQADAYAHYIKTNQEIYKHHRKDPFFFVKIYLKLLKVKCGQSKSNVQYIKSQIGEREESEFLWLNRKADELIKMSVKFNKVI